MILNGLLNSVMTMLNEDVTGCRPPCKSESVEGERTVFMQLKTLVNMSNIAIYYKNMDILVKEEVLLYDFNALVAAVGGSLGLFLGPSCYQMASELWIKFMLVRKSKRCF